MLVIRFSSLGDILLSSPTVLNLRLAFPDTSITYLTKESYAGIVRHFEGVDEVLTLPRNTGITGYLKLLLSQHDRHFSHVIDLHGNARSWLAGRLLNSEQQLVYPKRRPERKAMVRRHNKSLPEKPRHTIDAYNDTLRALQKNAPADRPLLPHTASRNSARTDITHRPAIVIAPGAAHAPKQFGVARYAAIGARLQDELDAHIIWAATSHETPLDQIDHSLRPERLTILIDQPLEQLADTIADSDLTIANDSGIAHLSSAVGTPVIALFGPTHPGLGFAPRGQFDRIVEVDEFCRPCSLHGAKPCYREEQYCFTRITDLDVITAATETLARRTALQPALFIDRDGTLIKEKHFLKDPDAVEFEPGAVATLAAFRDRKYRLVIISNQSGVARGKMSIADVEAVNARVLEMLAAHNIEIDGLYFCPYHTEGSIPNYTAASRDRKPAPGMIETAAAQLKIDIRRSLVVGDKRSDLHLAAVTGATGVLVRTGYGAETERRLSDWERSRFTVCNTLGDLTELL